MPHDLPREATPGQRVPFTPARRGFSSPAVALALVCLLGVAGQASPRPYSVINDFGVRVSKYLELRKQAAGDPSKSSNSAQVVKENQGAMAEKVRAARADARQGDIFSPKIAAYFRRQIARSLAGPDGAKVRSSLRHAEPVPAIVLHVNDTYPEGVPLQSTPPSLLSRLPPLPKELEYRLLGNDLVLHDTGPNLIIDFMPNAIAGATIKK